MEDAGRSTAIEGRAPPAVRPRALRAAGRGRWPGLRADTALAAWHRRRRRPAGLSPARPHLALAVDLLQPPRHPEPRDPALRRLARHPGRVKRHAHWTAPLQWRS